MGTDDSVTGPINIGNPVEISVAGLAAKVIEATGTDVAIERRPLPADDPRQRQPDITRARELLGWEPTVTLDDGLRRTVDYFREMATAA